MPRIVVIAIGRILNSVSAVLAVRLYTELLRPEQVGRLALFLSLTSFFTLVLVAPVSSFLMRKAIEWHAEGTLIEELRRPLVYACSSSALVAVISAVLIQFGLVHTSTAAGLIIGLTFLGVAVSTAGTTLFNYLGQPVKYVALSCATSWGGAALAGLLCWRVSATAEAWLTGITAAQLLFGFVSIILIRRISAIDKSRTLRPAGDHSAFSLRTIALYSTPLLAATGLSWVQTDGYRYIFAHMIDERNLGLFAAGIAVGLSPMLLLERLLNDTYTPILTRALALNGREHWTQSWDVYASACILPLVLFTMLACSGTTLFARLLVSHTYYAVAWLGALGAAAKCLQMVSSLYVGFSYGALETSHLVGPYFAGAAVTIGCIFVLFPLSPFMRFGVSLVCGAAAALVTNAWAARKRYNIRFPFFACARAVALGLPIIGMNYAAESVFPGRSIPGAVGLLAVDTIYMAVLCWILRPKDVNDESRLSVATTHPEEQVAQP